jgi:hypothetical protein
MEERQRQRREWTERRTGTIYLPGLRSIFALSVLPIELE